MTSDLTQVAVSSDSDDYKNVFCNPAFELEGEREDRVEGFRTTSSTPEPIKPAAAGQGVFQVCALRFRVWSGCGLGAVLVSAAVVFLIAALGLTLVLILTQLSGQEVEEGEVVSVSPLDPQGGGGVSYTVPALVSNSSVGDVATTTAPQPTGHSPTAQTRCGGILSDPEGSFSSPNHPGSYPPNSQCVWVIRVQPPALVQIHVSSLTVEGPSPCLFDWLEVREQSEHSAVVTRFCGSVAPPTVNSNSSVVLVTFHSDASISGAGFTAQYRAVQSKSCLREEFQCDGGRCLLPVSVCDGHAHCTDQSDEAHCEHIHKECGGQKNGSSGYLTSPNHPRPYPHQQFCTWRISAEEGHVITLSFQNFSLETQDVCEFDYVEIHDSADTGAGRTLGRFCGTDGPPEMTSSGPQMTVVFVADEGVSDSGFSATYRAVSVTNRTCAPEQFSCSTGQCLQREWICDGWNDCSDGGDERDCGNATYPQFTSSCELIEVQMCRDLSYNQTSFPNIWLSVADQREASMLLRHYQVLTELPCFEPLRRLLCGMFVPQCSPHGGVLQPCRSVCSSAQLQCAQALDVFAFSWPFNCHLLPDSQDPMECCLP